jgi:deoxyribonuclease-4
MDWGMGAAGSRPRPARVVAHNSYLINLAQPDRWLWRKCVESQRIEVERCEALEIPCCVTHPGAHLSSARTPPGAATAKLNGSPSRHELAALKRIAKALDAIHGDLPGYRTITCLETTAGAGTNLGYDFHHLAFVRACVRQPERVGFCFDTCHVTAAGYDMSSADRARSVLEHWDDICGLENLRVFHLNDSRGAVGSRLDRHAHIGQGCCGLSCFRVIVNHPVFHYVPKILETPRGRDENGLEWDLVNLRRLRRMTRAAHALNTRNDHAAAMSR